MNKPILALLLFYIFSLFATSCGSDDEPEVPILSQIQISSSNSTRLDIVIEESTQLTVQGSDQFDDQIDIANNIEWSLSNSNISMDADGNITPLSVGETVVTASVDGFEDRITIEIWDSSAPRTDIFVSDVGVNRNGPHQILRFDENGENPEKFITSNLNRPQDIVFLEDQGIVLVSNLGSDNISKFDSETGRFVGFFASSLGAPTRMDIGPDDLLYTIPWNGGFVKRYELDGTFVDDFTDVSINESIGMAWDTGGNLYISSFGGGNAGSIRKFDTDGQDMGTFVNSNISGPTDIWFDSDGSLLVNDWSANRIVRFNAAGTFLGVLVSNVSNPEGVAILDDGSILIGASGTSSVKRYQNDGTFIEDFVPSGRGDLATPNAVVIRKVNQ